MDITTVYVSEVAFDKISSFRIDGTLPRPKILICVWELFNVSETVNPQRWAGRFDPTYVASNNFITSNIIRI